MRAANRSDSAVVAVIALLVGVIVGACGTVVHRWESADLPVGMVLALVAAVVGAVFARAMGDGVGVFLYGLAGILTSQAMTFLRPGGDVLVTGEALSYFWLLGLPFAAVVAGFTPRSWYADLPASSTRQAGPVADD